jgi:DNA primase
MISKDLLRRLRNDLPMRFTIATLGREAPPSKMSDGYFRFLCPRCGEMRATVNPRNNLAHCFCCQQNLNNIDLLITLGYDFRSAVTILERWLNLYQARLAKKKTPTPRTHEQLPTLLCQPDPNDP